ncbi:MAG: single-stranded DNA-binding protein [Kiritimatiellia bacterium]
MSASLNRIVLCGNLTADPELSYTPSGMAIAQLRLAVNEQVKNQQGEWVDRPCYVDVTAFGRQAETCNEYLEKGSPVLLEGKLRYETWEAKDGGGKRSKHSVVADRVQFLGTRREGGSTASTPAKPAIQPPKPPLADGGDDEDIPPF